MIYAFTKPLENVRQKKKKSSRITAGTSLRMKPPTPQFQNTHSSIKIKAKKGKTSKVINGEILAFTWGSLADNYIACNSEVMTEAKPAGNESQDFYDSTVITLEIRHEGR